MDVSLLFAAFGIRRRHVFAQPRRRRVRSRFCFAAPGFGLLRQFAIESAGSIGRSRAIEIGRFTERLGWVAVIPSSLFYVRRMFHMRLVFTRSKSFFSSVEAMSPERFRQQRWAWLPASFGHRTRTFANCRNLSIGPPNEAVGRPNLRNLTLNQRINCRLPAPLLPRSGPAPREKFSRSCLDFVRFLAALPLGPLRAFAPSREPPLRPS